MEVICISNKSGNPNLKIGKKYRADKDSNPKVMWVKFEDVEGNFFLQQCYSNDFVDVITYRNVRIDKLID